MTDRSRRILHIFPSFSIGGQQRRLASLVDGLGPDFSHRIVSLDGDNSARRLFETKIKVEPFVLAKSGFLHLHNLRRLLPLITEAGADLLCTYNFGSIEAVIANQFMSRIPHVHHEDGFGPDESEARQKKTRMIARGILLRNSIVTVPSFVLERIALRSWRLPPDRVRRIPVGVDVARFKKRSPATAGPVIVGALGSLRTEKNYARLIRCFEKASEGRSARLVICGDGPERERLSALVNASSASGRISLPGATDRPEGVLAEFDIFALSSDTEQMPISLIEAMATGLPAIATDVGDIRGMIGEAGGDFVVGAGDERRYAAQLRALIDNRELRQRLGAASALRARDFALDGMVEAFRSLYKGVMGEAR